MKKRMFWATIFVATVFTCVAVGYTTMSKEKIEAEKEAADTCTEDTTETPSDTADEDEDYCEVLRMADAFAMVESRMNPNARNGNCVGYLQITPWVVKEVNRLEGYECFTMADREDMYASIAMFYIIQRRYNPEMDLKKACKVWNPRAGEWYYKKVKKAYDEQEGGKRDE